VKRPRAKVGNGEGMSWYLNSSIFQLCTIVCGSAGAGYADDLMSFGDDLDSFWRVAMSSESTFENEVDMVGCFDGV
jgi:hypothetical protein